MGENSIFSLSVQFLNRANFVSHISLHHGYLHSTCSSLERMLVRELETSIEHRESVVTSRLLKYRRYYPIIADLKIVFAIQGCSHMFLATCQPSWLTVLGLFQYLHPQRYFFIPCGHHMIECFVNLSALYLREVTLQVCCCLGIRPSCPSCPSLMSLLLLLSPPASPPPSPPRPFPSDVKCTITWTSRVGIG